MQQRDFDATFVVPFSGQYLFQVVVDLMEASGQSEFSLLVDGVKHHTENAYCFADAATTQCNVALALTAGSHTARVQCNHSASGRVAALRLALLLPAALGSQASVALLIDFRSPDAPVRKAQRGPGPVKALTPS